MLSLSHSVVTTLIIYEKMKWLLVEWRSHLASSFWLALWWVMSHEENLEPKNLNKIRIHKNVLLETHNWIEFRLLNSVNWATIYGIRSSPSYTIYSIHDLFCFAAPLRCYWHLSHWPYSCTHLRTWEPCWFDFFFWVVLCYMKDQIFLLTKIY